MCEQPPPGPRGPLQGAAAGQALREGQSRGGGWAWGAQSQGQRRSLAGGRTQDAGAGAPPASGRSLRTGRTGRGPVRQAPWAAWPSLPSVLPALDPGHVLRSREARAPATHITSTRPSVTPRP